MSNFKETTSIIPTSVKKETKKLFSEDSYLSFDVAKIHSTLSSAVVLAAREAEERRVGAHSDKPRSITCITSYDFNLIKTGPLKNSYYGPVQATMCIKNIKNQQQRTQFQRQL